MKDTCAWFVDAKTFLIAWMLVCASLPTLAEGIAASPPREVTTSEITMDDVPNLIRVPLARQATDHTCGVASLQSVLGYYSVEIREEILARELNADDYARAKFIKSFAEKQGLTVTEYHEMSLELLKEQIDHKSPVMVCLQAWSENSPTLQKYKDDWDDGHWVVVVGYDQKNVYVMDPSTFGHYAYVPTGEFLARWHDYDDENHKQLVQYALAFQSREESTYNPRQIKYME